MSKSATLASKKADSGVCTIDLVQQHADLIRRGEARVKPGQPATFTAVCTPDDVIAQGDLYISPFAGEIPGDYVLREELKTQQDLQLVPGNTQGARHCLSTGVGVKMWHPKNWDGNDLRGPIVQAQNGVEILHPTHGTVTLLPGQMYICGYQPEYDAQLRAERRNAD